MPDPRPGYDEAVEAACAYLDPHCPRAVTAVDHGKAITAAVYPIVAREVQAAHEEPVRADERRRIVGALRAELEGPGAIDAADRIGWAAAADFIEQVW